MTRAIGYVRVSTEEQFGDDKYGVESQKQAILDYAAENGYEIIDWKMDIISGAKDDRPELDRLLYHPEELPFHKAIIVFKNDRVARDLKLYFYYFYTLEKRNVKLLSTEEHFAEGDEFANIYRSLLMFVAEQERKNINLRTGRGRMMKAQCGGYSGGRAAYGYKVVDSKLIVDETEKKVVQFVFAEHLDHKSMTDIADMLYDNGYRTRKGGRFQVSTIKSILSHEEFYRGKYKYGKVDWVNGIQDPILGENL
jgi:DNA invertase Pin-like site-specific DNA recombinase